MVVLNDSEALSDVHRAALKPDASSEVGTVGTREALDPKNTLKLSICVRNFIRRHIPQSNPLKTYI